MVSFSGFGLGLEAGLGPDWLLNCDGLGFGFDFLGLDDLAEIGPSTLHFIPFFFNVD